MGIALAAFMLSLVGCGGDGPASGNGNGGGGGGGGGNPVAVLRGPGDQSGTPVPSATKYADMDKVVAAYKVLIGNKVAPLVRDQQLLKTIQGIPDFKESGLSVDGTVWGRFQDNSYYMFNDHDVPDSFVSAAKSGVAFRAPQLPAPSLSSHPMDSGAAEMVSGANAYVLDVFDGSMGTPNTQITKMLTKRGYSVTSARATLPILRSLTNISVLYWSSHGGQASNYLWPNSNFWSVWTATLANEASDQANYDDLIHGRLVVFDAPAGKAVGPFKNMERRYAITASWVTYYKWNFTKNSVAFINCCWSEAGGFCGALRSLSSPANMTYGWSNAANPDAAWKSAAYFFDRALGTDLAEPNMPGKLRPFSADSVFGKMDSSGLAVAPTTQYGACQLYENARNDVMLAPSVANMTLYDMPFKDASPHSQLVLTGFFGSSAPGIVRIDGTSVPFKYISKTEIDVTPPTSSSAAGYAGGVQVETPEGVKGNAAPLTSWNGTFEYDANPVPKLITGKVLMTGSFRADIHKYRKEVDGDLIDPTATYDRISMDTQANWAATGKLPYSTDITPQSGMYSYGLDSSQNPPYGAGFQLDAMIDRKAGTFNLAYLYLGMNWTIHIEHAPDNQTFVIPGDPKLVNIESAGNPDKFGFPQYPMELMGTLNGNFGTPKVITKGQGYDATGAQFIFPALTPNFAPTSDAEEDVS